ncbi:MAG: heavy metal-associated domain-containing protein [Pseudomonadota bacterium]
MIEVSIQGMTCPHCVANVKKTLEVLDGVTSAEVSLENNHAIVEHSNPDLAKDVLIKAIVDAGYEAS